MTSTAFQGHTIWTRHLMGDHQAFGYNILYANEHIEIIIGRASFRCSQL
jgi:hypothetical protein